MTLDGLRIALVGPMPPPEGGMANQTRQLGELLQREGAKVSIVAVNAPYRPAWIAKLRVIRAAFRLVPYVVRLWRVGADVELFHVMANSGWSWYVFAAPALWIARLRGVASVVNYRGGEAETFLQRSGARVRRTMRVASMLVVPSPFLQQIFARQGIASEIVANIVDTERFRPGRAAPTVPRVVVARNLERIYDIGTALRAFALLRAEVPGALLTVAGSGSERDALRALAAELRIAEAVDFCGRVDRDRIAALYRSASVVLNPSRVDNMPNSVLEAMASGVPVVSTDVGGVPFIVKDGVTGLLVPAGDAAAMAAAMRRVLGEPGLAAALRRTALNEVHQYTWPRVRERWIEVYAAVLSSARVAVRAA